MLIREATPADDAAILALWGACFPFLVLTEAVIRAREAGSPPAERRLTVVGEVDGRVAGFATGRFDLESQDSDVAVLNLMVLPGDRHAGVGTALYERSLKHLRDIGARRIVVRVGDDDGLAFGTKRGLAVSRTERISVVDPRTIPAPPPMPEGLTLRSVADVADLRPVYDLDCAASLDVPSDTPFEPWSYEEWLRVIVGTPIFDAEASMVAYDGDLAVSLACVESAGERMFSGLAGTLADYRGRGLARIVKSHALRRAADKGVVEAYTNNDAGNAPMLAVNDRLGYTEHARLSVLIGEI